METITNVQLYNLSQTPPALYPLGELCLFGSDESCHVRLEQTLAPRHARIEKKNSDFIIRDLRTKDGTHVNGTKIIEAFLNNGDIISVGNQEFLFQFPSASETLQTELTSKNESLARVLEKIPSIAKSQFSALILGPSGSGKEIIARSLHDLSDRSPFPFISVNCCALSESLIESELFGHIKGSFTGATCDRKGAFESARGGTLFLDEIGDLPLSLQAKLLRALENNEIKPVGADRPIKTDVRVIAATHQDLCKKISSKEFRADLYFRLNVIHIQLPALKDRMEDFLSLLYSFAKKFRVRFSYGATQALMRHSWDGNIRELKNVVARASVIYKGHYIQEEDIQDLLQATPIQDTPAPYVDNNEGNLSVIREIERNLIVKRLSANHGNQRQTARDLNMPKSTLHDRIKTYNINLEEFKSN